MYVCLLLFQCVCMWKERKGGGVDHDVDSDVNVITDLSINAGNDV